MNNCGRHVNHKGCGHHHGEGRNCHKNGEGCQNGQHKGQCGVKGGGKKKELFLNKYNEYLKTITLPEFDSDEQYCQWLSETEEGKLHTENIKRINEEVDTEIPWGGKRENAGRQKECVRKVPYTRRISPQILEILKKYAQEHNITETEALERAIASL